MTASEAKRLLNAFHQGFTAGMRDCPRSKCHYAPTIQAPQFQAWMIGYEEAYERYCRK